MNRIKTFLDKGKLVIAENVDKKTGKKNDRFNSAERQCRNNATFQSA